MTFTIVDDDTNPDGVNLAYLCDNFGLSCSSNTTMTWDGVAGTASGTITVAGGLVDVDLTISVIAFTGSDSGVSNWALETLNYVATGLAFGGGDTDDSFIVSTTAGNLASASGTENEDGGLSAFADATVAIVVDCDEIAANTLKCGLSVAGTAFNVDVGGSARFIEHNIDVTAVPEPHLAVMALTFGISGLTYARRKRTN